jgi:hypothetical protein
LAGRSSNPSLAQISGLAAAKQQAHASKHSAQKQAVGARRGLQKTAKEFLDDKEFTTQVAMMEQQLP